MIRIIIIGILVGLFFVFSMPLYFALWVIGKFNPSVKDRASLSIVKWAFGVVLFVAGTKVTVLGEENLPKDRSVLYVGNHRSFFDIIINYRLVPGLTGFVAKKETNKVPFLRLWMKNVKCLFLDRQDIKQGLQIILTAIEQVKNGISIFIFPEGTRNKEEGTFLPFKAGSFKIATKSGCDIIPVAICNSAAILENQFPKIKKAHVVVEYGAPIVVKDLDKEQLKIVHEIAQNRIMEMYNKNKDLV